LCHWFCGYIEGKADITPPDWWRESLENLKVSENSKSGFVFRSKLDEAQSYEFRVVKDTAFVSVGEKEFELPKTTFIDAVNRAEKNGGARKIALAISNDDGLVVFAIFNNFGAPFSVICVDKKSKRMIWSQTVKGGNRGVLLGTNFQNISISMNDHDVTVWGCEGASLFFENFDLKSGRKRCFYYCGEK
jgi:hypothetical protein